MLPLFIKVQGNLYHHSSISKCLEEKLTDKKKRRVVVWDTSALIAGIDPFSITGKQYTVPRVQEETSRESMVKFRLKMAIESGKLRIRTPEKEYIKRVESSAKQLGDSFLVSEADIQVLALALQLKEEYKPIIATDDYSIQNIADQIGIEFSPLSTLGIRFRLRWVRYCPACYRQYSSEYDSAKCQVCGTKLKRKASEKEKLNRK